MRSEGKHLEGAERRSSSEDGEAAWVSLLTHHQFSQTPSLPPPAPMYCSLSYQLPPSLSHCQGGIGAIPDDRAVGGFLPVLRTASPPRSHHRQGGIGAVPDDSAVGGFLPVVLLPPPFTLTARVASEQQHPSSTS